MQPRQLLAFPISVAIAMALPWFSAHSLFAQSASLNLGARLTTSTSYYAEGLGSGIAFSGDTVLAEGNSSDAPDYMLPVYVFQKAAGGWANETETAVLTPSDATGFSGGGLAIDGNTALVSSDGKVYIFEKPSTGWKNAHEVAQLSIPNDGCGGWIAGDTILLGCQLSAYIFVKPAGGWVTTSAYAAQLSLPSYNYPQTLAFDGETAAIFNGLGVYVFEKPAQGWATTAKPAAFLTPAGTGTNAFGYALAVSGDTIAVAAPFTHDPNGQYGVVDLFVKPSTGWKNMHETAKISAPLNTGELAPSLAMNNEHLVVGTSTNKLYVYSKPAAGWKSGPWPSQVFIGQTNQGDGPGYNFGFTVALDGDTIVAGAQAARIDGGVEAAGAVYVFPLSPSAIQISTDTLDFPDMSFGNSAVLPLTITNPSANTLNFTTSLSAPNFQVLKTAENTCIGGVPPGQSCVLPVQFNPPAVGLHTNYLTLSSPSTASFRIIQLRGLAEGLGANSETPLSALANVGTPVTLPLVLKNFGLPGSPTVSVSFSNPVYSLASGGTCTTTGVPEGQTCTLTIEFSPTTGGEFKGNVILTPSSGATSLVPIACAAEY